MNGLEITDIETLQIFLCDRYGCVPKDFGEVKQISPIAEVCHRECVP